MKCSKCKTEKDLPSFRKSKKTKSGYNSLCKECESKTQKEWYTNNKERVLDRVKISNKKIREKIREYIKEYLSSNPCVNCGENDIVVLEFDHLRDKHKNITQLLRNTSIRLVKEEIEKCQVLCANCHRRKTAKEQCWYKLEK